MKIALLRNLPDKNAPIEAQVRAVGNNSGNIVFWNAIMRLFDVDVVSFSENARLKDYDAVITTGLCWVRENTDFSFLEALVDKFEIPFIPMSIGLQNSDFGPSFKLSEQCVRLLDKLQRRAVLGVRGGGIVPLYSKNTA